MATYPWDIYLILTGAGLFGVLAMIPYIRGLGASQLFKDRGISPPPVVLVVIQQAVTMAAAGGIGLLIAPKIGLRLPVIERLSTGEPILPVLQEMLPLALLVGLIGGTLILLADLYLFLPHLPKNLRSINAEISLSQRLLTPFTGGIVEEIILRFFAFSLVAWLLGLVWSGPEGLPAAGAFWTAAVISALLFAVLHLPATAAITPLTPLVVVRALLLNGILGVAFGYLFWQYGLEAAMAAHFAADVVVHIIGGLFIMKRTEDQSMTFVQNE